MPPPRQRWPRRDTVPGWVLPRNPMEARMMAAYTRVTVRLNFFPITVWPHFIRMAAKEIKKDQRSRLNLTVFLLGNGFPAEYVIKFVLFQLPGAGITYDAAAWNQVRWLVQSSNRLYNYYYYDITAGRTLPLAVPRGMELHVDLPGPPVRQDLDDEEAIFGGGAALVAPAPRPTYEQRARFDSAWSIYLADR